jgi:hypothetical protein
VILAAVAAVLGVMADILIIGSGFAALNYAAAWLGR